MILDKYRPANHQTALKSTPSVRRERSQRVLLELSLVRGAEPVVQVQVTLGGHARGIVHLLSCEHVIDRDQQLPGGGNDGHLVILPSL